MTRGCKCNVEQQCLWVYDEVFDDYNPKLPEPDKFGSITGVVLCKILCSGCREIYLTEVPVIKFTDNDTEEVDSDVKDRGDDYYEDDGHYDEDEDDDREDEEWRD
jgi:hypothetical protein